MLSYSIKTLAFGLIKPLIIVAISVMALILSGVVPIDIIFLPAKLKLLNAGKLSSSLAVKLFLVIAVVVDVNVPDIVDISFSLYHE